MPVTSIPVCQPKLPMADKIFPYLQQIDKNKWYTNFGPLLNLFLERVAKLFQISPSQLVSGTNGTLLLELCLKALEVPEGSLCILPSWTFAATAQAVISAKLEPFFVDVDVNMQSIEPKNLLNALPKIAKSGKIGAVIITAPFGNPIDVQSWDQFTEETKIPVIIDAAAAFDSMLQEASMKISKTPMMVSLHATKVFGIGEAGLLFSTNEELTLKIESLTQFGFPRNIRSAHYRGTNAKTCEYIAAVGLAALDEWQETRFQWLNKINHYINTFDKLNIKHMLSAKWATSTCNIIIPYQADYVGTMLNEKNIYTRKWWSDGCHHMPAFNTYKRGKLENTEFLRQSVLGLPLYLEMELKEIDLVCEELNYILDQLFSFSKVKSYEKTS